MSDEIKQNNQKSNDSVFKSETPEYLEENSTIFTKKAETDSPKKLTKGEGKKRVSLTIISLILAVAVFTGIFAVIKFIPDVEVSSSNGGTGVEMITFDKKTISSVTVNYENMNSTFTKHIDDTVSSASTSSSEQKYYWTIDGIDRNWLSSSDVEGYIAQYASLKAVKSIDFSEEIDYGFEKPNLTAEIKTDDGKYDYKLTVGNQIASLGEYYVQLNDRYYVMTGNSLESLLALNTDFANKTLFSPIDIEDVPEYYNQEVLSYFDYINVSGSNFDKDIRIICDKDDASYNYYFMTAPYNRFADSEFLDGFFSMFTDGLNASGVFSFTHTDAEMRKYGLDNPVAELIVKIDDYIIKLTVGEEVDGYYPVLYGDNEPIYMMSTQNNSMFFVDSKVEEYVSILTIGDFISEISSFRFVFDGFDKTIKLEHDDDDSSIWTPTVDGDEINKTSVQNLYQHVILASPIEIIFAADRSDVLLKIVVSYTDGAPDRLIEFTTHDEGSRRYVCWVDGEPQGIVTKDRVDNIISNVQKVVNGEVISSPI